MPDKWEVGMMTFLLYPLKKPIPELREFHIKDSYILLDIIILDNVRSERQLLCLFSYLWTLDFI